MRAIIAISFILISWVGLAQNDIVFSVVANNNKALVGEPINLKITLDVPSNIKQELVSYPTITDSTELNEGIEIWNVSPPKKNVLDNNMGEVITRFEQEITVATFDTGTVNIGPIYTFINGDQVESNLVSVIVSVMPTEDTEDIRDLKGLENDPFTSWEKFLMWLKVNWWWIAIILGLIVGWIIYLVVKNQPKVEKEIKSKVPLPQLLLERLQIIDQKKLWQDNQTKLYYSNVTEVSWQYLEYKFQVQTFEKTSNQILDQLRMKNINPEQFSELEKLYRLSDMVKFAKTEPTPSENAQAIEIVKTLIKRTEQQS